jgi:hypothetical protein
MLTLTKWWVPVSASKWQMEFNSEFKGLSYSIHFMSELHKYKLFLTAIPVL